MLLNLTKTDVFYKKQPQKTLQILIEKNMYD